jgi:hypothetical protein
LTIDDGLTIDEALTNGKIILIDDGATAKNKYNFGLSLTL